MPKTTFLDLIDRRLLMLVQKDSRISHQELGSAVGLSTSAVNERVRRLSSENVITGCHARVDPTLVGLEIAAFLSVAIETPEQNAAFLELIRALPEVLECHHVTGEFSFLLKVQVCDTSHLELLLTNGIKSIKGVTRTLTAIILSSPKNLPVVDCLHDLNRPGSSGGLSS
jgi:Lrp/AsnC family leucine-responsive transcriptional regulator